MGDRRKYLWRGAARLIAAVLTLWLPPAIAGAADIPSGEAGLTILGMTDDYLGPLAQGDLNGDGVADLAIGAPGT
ncbi:MAG: hypothetical protein GX444_18005 [Myxococcales bacterium]|nr:hypothetical protein [Myxococcales bacterium]